MSQEKKVQASWKSQLYIFGLAIGAALGFLSAYLFANEAEKDAEEEGKRPDVSPIVMLGVATSVLSLVRNIAETGKKPKDNKDKERKK
jgi:gas vesicle protein